MSLESAIVIDAAFLRNDRREPFLKLARKSNVPFEIIDCGAPFDELCRRLQSRTNEPSEADIDVLKMQMNNHDPLNAEELSLVRSR